MLFKSLTKAKINKYCLFFCFAFSVTSFFILIPPSIFHAYSTEFSKLKHSYDNNNTCVAHSEGCFSKFFEKYDRKKQFKKQVVFVSVFCISWLFINTFVFICERHLYLHSLLILSQKTTERFFNRKCICILIWYFLFICYYVYLPFAKYNVFTRKGVMFSNIIITLIRISIHKSGLKNFEKDESE